MKKNIITIALFSLISLSLSPMQSELLRPVSLEKRSALTRILDYSGVTRQIQQHTPKKMISDRQALPQQTHPTRTSTTTTQQYSTRTKSSPVAIPSSIAQIHNPQPTAQTEKYDFNKVWEEMKKRPRNPMPDPRKTPFKV